MLKEEKRGGCKAVIEIGSNALRLKIAEAHKNKIKYVEEIVYDLSLGRDTFDDGRIKFDNLEKACAVVKNFLNAARGYAAGEIRIVATTAVREAINREYILDQLKINTGYTVEVIDDAQEKLYIYKFMTSMLDESLRRSAVLVYIGSGSMGLALMTDGRIPYAHNIKIGSLRISEMFNKEQEHSSDFYVMVEEYLNGFTDGIAENLPETLRDFIASGQEIALLAELCAAADDGMFLYISRENFMRVYNEIKYKSTDSIALAYRLPSEKAEVLLPAMAIFKRLLDITGAPRIIAPSILLADALLFKMLRPKAYAGISKEFSKHTLLHARRVAARYNVPKSHSVRVEQYSVKIFDKMKKIHGMGAHEKLLLQTAAILHDIGKFINFQQHYLHSYNIIKGLNILGLSNLDREITACICLYHSSRLPSQYDSNYGSLSPTERVLVSKLTAIMRLADALNRNNKNEKFTDIDVIVDDALAVTVSTGQHIDLEQWAFTQKSAFFEEVFGIKAILKKRG